MADLMSAVKEMMIEIREMIKEQKEYHETLKEITIENKKLKKKVEVLEEKLEKIEKDQRKSNIIIKSEDFQHNIGKEQVKQFIEEKIGVPVEIEEVQVISNNKKHQTIVRAKINSFENKILIMKNKSKLKGTKYYIESDFTKSEEKIQKKLREIAKEEKVKGKIAVVKYQKIKINGKWMFWDTSRSVLAESKSINFSKN